MFQPIALETLGVFNESTYDFLDSVGQKITSRSGDPRERSFLYQRISIILQRFNSVLLHDSFPAADHTEHGFRPEV